jgi:signal transduction histidine kinase
MSRPTYRSFRLLHHLEWLLIATAVIVEIVSPPHTFWPLSWRIIIITVFGLMSLRLPAHRLSSKVLFTALEFGCVLIPAVQNQFSARTVFLLSLVLVMRSCILFNRLGQVIVIAVALLSLGGLILLKPITTNRFNGATWDWRLSSMLLFSLTLIFALLLINALLAERQSRERLELAHQELELAHEQLQYYALRVEDQATLQERNRIAREIHDGLGHTLAAQTIQLNNALLVWDANHDKALAFLKQAKQLGSEALLEIRRSLSVLRSNPLQGQSLPAALDQLLTNFQQNTGIELRSTIDLPVFLPPEVTTTLYRIVQESLTNIQKHSHATVVTIHLQLEAEMLRLIIEDDGEGFNPTQNTTGFGLQGMRERAAMLGGEFYLDSQFNKGCHILVLLPLPKKVKV